MAVKNRIKENRGIVFSSSHNVDQNLKISLKEFDILVVFSAPNRQGKLDANVKTPSEKQSQCKKRHMHKFNPCQEGAGHTISHLCCAVCNGQTG